MAEFAVRPEALRWLGTYNGYMLVSDSPDEWLRHFNSICNHHVGQLRLDGESHFDGLALVGIRPAQSVALVCRGDFSRGEKKFYKIL